MRAAVVTAEVLLEAERALEVKRRLLRMLQSRLTPRLWSRFWLMLKLLLRRRWHP